MRVNLADHVDRHIFYWGAYEPIESFLFLSSITPGMTVIDAGANIGQYTVLSAQAVGPGGRVLSFEPSPRNFARLEENVQMNEFRNVQLFRSALWDREATLSFRFPETGNSGSFRQSESGEVEVKAMALDDLPGLTRVDLIKIDVEGSEPRVLLGAQAILRKFRPMILMEVNRQALMEGGTDTSHLLDVLKDLGYRMWRIGSAAQDSGDVESLDSIQRSNCIAHCGELPDAILRNWTERSPRKWARSSWFLPTLIPRA